MMLNDRLQIQLEKIRQAENEVRWQHEDDVEDCTNCKQAFSVTKKKGMKKPKQVQTNFNQVLKKKRKVWTHLVNKGINKTANLLRMSHFDSSLKICISLIRFNKFINILQKRWINWFCYKFTEFITRLLAATMFYCR